MFFKKLVAFSRGSIALIGTAATMSLAVSPTEQKAWEQYLLPLPQEITIEQMITVKPSEISLLIDTNAGPIQAQIYTELTALINSSAETMPDNAAFQIVLGMPDEQGLVAGRPLPDVAQLDNCPNRDQAYLIRPDGENRLIVAAKHPHGLYYGTQTLKQLLMPHITQTAVRIPLAVVTDWPDMEERGPWNIKYAAPDFIPWLAALKLNLTICKPRPIFRQDTPASFPPGQIPVAQIQAAARHAFLLLPHTPHPDYFWQFGFTNVYPELVGKGDSALHFMAKLYSGPKQKQFEQCRAPCASQPGFTRVMDEMVQSAAEQGVRELSIWLSEFTPQQCGCAECLSEGPRQFQLETQAGVAALMRARQTHPGFTGRICFTFLRMEDHYPQAAEECLALIPPEGIRVEAHYSPKKPILDYAAKGGRVTSYDGLFLNQTWSRFDLGSDMRHSVSNLLAKHYSGVVCLDGRSNEEFSQVWGDFQYHSLAEWTWNAKGRSPRDLATAWAVRQGLPYPDRFSDWFAAFEPLAKTVRLYERSPGWEKIVAAAAEGLPLPAGSPARAEIDRQWAECATVRQLAKDSHASAAEHETRLIHANLTAMRLVLDLHARLAATATDTQPPLPDEPARLKADICQAWDNYVEGVVAYGQSLKLEENVIFQQRLKALEVSTLNLTRILHLKNE